MNIKPLKTAVLGCGAISDAYITTIQSKFKILELVACANRTHTKAEKTAEKYGLKAVSVQQILEDPEIELVINLTPTTSHFETTKMLLEAGKHVYTEKVLALTFEQAKTLAALAEEKGLYLGSAPDTFLGSAIQTARYVVDSGMIGRVTSCCAVMTRDYKLFLEMGPRAADPGWGVATDLGIYCLTALLSILGPVKTVAGQMRSLDKGGVCTGVARMGESYTVRCENLGTGILEFHSGAGGTVLFNSNSVLTFPEKPLLVLHGTLGICYMPDPNLFGGEVRVLLEGQTEPFTVPPVHPFDTESRGVGAAEMAWAIRQNRPNRASKEMALHAVEILHGMTVSGESRCYYDMTTTFTPAPALPRGYRQCVPLPVSEEGAIAQPFG